MKLSYVRSSGAPKKDGFYYQKKGKGRGSRVFGKEKTVLRSSAFLSRRVFTLAEPNSPLGGELLLSLRGKAFLGKTISDPAQGMVLFMTSPIFKGEGGKRSEESPIKRGDDKEGGGERRKSKSGGISRKRVSGSL